MPPCRYRPPRSPNNVGKYGGADQLLRPSHPLFLKITEWQEEFLCCLSIVNRNGWLKMLAEHIRYLREKAKQFREVAGSYRSALAAQLLELADEFEAKAAELEAGSASNPAQD
jgi:hypothetical protein